MVLALKNLLFTLVVPGTVGVYVPLMLSRNRAAGTGSIFALALLLFTIGGSIYAGCVFDFASFGRGTPLPLNAPKYLVRRGLYRHSRNPMYVGVLTVIFGWAVLYQSLAVAVYGPVVGYASIHSSYSSKSPFSGSGLAANMRQYCAEVPRWL